MATPPPDRPKRYHSRGKRVARPDHVHDATTRGQALLWWLQQHDRGIAEFALEAGLGRSTLQAYIRGEHMGRVYDIADMRQESVEKLLTVMSVPDTWAWEFFNIPDAKRGEWRTFRPHPYGHGEVLRTIRDEPLTVAIQGEIAIPANPSWVAKVDPNDRTGLQLVRQLDRLYAMPAEAATQGEVIGRLVTIEFSGP